MFFLLLLPLSAAMGQEVVPERTDTIITNLGIKYGGAFVSQIPAPDKPIRVKLAGRGDDLFEGSSMNEIRQIDFADGFTIYFRDGVPVRDNLLSCPNILARGSRLAAEGVVRLNRAETIEYCGPRPYYLGLLPGKTQVVGGIAQLGVGLAGFFTGAYYLGLPLLQIGNIYYSKSFKVWTTPVIFLSGGLILSGIVNTSLGSGAISRTIRDRDGLTPRSEGFATAEFWSGTGSLALGAAALTAGFLDLQNEYAKTRRAIYVNGESVDAIRRAGGMPARPFLLMLGGAALSATGVSLMIVGASRLSGYRRLKLAGDTLVFTF